MKRFFGIFLFVVVLAMIGVGVFWAGKGTSSSTILTSIKESVTPTSTTTSGSFRLATSLGNSQIVGVISKYFQPDDIIDVRSTDLGSLTTTLPGKPMLIYGKNDSESEALQQASQYHLTMIGYNLEQASLSQEELVEKESAAYAKAKAAGLFFIFAPLAIHVEKYGAVLSPHADAFVLQARN